MNQGREGQCYGCQKVLTVLQRCWGAEKLSILCHSQGLEKERRGKILLMQRARLWFHYDFNETKGFCTANLYISFTIALWGSHSSPTLKASWDEEKTETGELTRKGCRVEKWMERAYVNNGEESTLSCSMLVSMELVDPGARGEEGVRAGFMVLGVSLSGCFVLVTWTASMGRARRSWRRRSCDLVSPKASSSTTKELLIWGPACRVLMFREQNMVPQPTVKSCLLSLSLSSKILYSLWAYTLKIKLCSSADSADVHP